MPKFSGYYTQYGRPIYYDDNGHAYSERSATIRGPDGYWYNVPTVLEGGNTLPKQAVDFFYHRKGFIDPVTGAPLDKFSDPDEAVKAAVSRSRNMRWIARGGK